MTTEADVSKAAAIAIPLAAAACSPIFGIGAPVCAAGAAVAAALTAAGVAISSALRDKFHVSIAQAEALLTLIRLTPWVLFIGKGGIDNTGSVAQGAKLVRYLRAASGEVPAGVAQNTGHLHNPSDTGDCPDNPYLCNVDPAEPLTDPAVVQRIYNAWRAWQQAGSNLSTLGSAIPTEYQTADAAAALLQIVRMAPAPFVDVMGWSFAKKPGIKAQMREAVRHARLVAGESGPDPDPQQVLKNVFGGDVSVAVAAPAPVAPAPVAPPDAAPAPEAEPPPDVANDMDTTSAVVRTTEGTTVEGAMDEEGIRAGLLTTAQGDVYRPLGWWSGLWVRVIVQERSAA